MTKEEEISPEEVAHAKEIAEGGMVFDELIHGYHHKFNDKEATAYKDMESEMKVFYNKTNNMGDPTEQIPLDVQPKTNIHPDVCNGITLYQLRGLWANVERRCVYEGWTDWTGVPLTPKTVNLYDVRKYVVEPFTEAKRKSFVACLPSSSRYQVPRIFISAPFILPIGELVLCLEAFVQDFRTNFSDAHDEKGGGMTEHTPVWLLGFARNIWNATTYEDDPMQTPMAKVIKETGNRVMSITDKDGQYFTRAWPTFESSLAIKHGLWYIYTAHDSKHHNGAVGLISGGATSDLHAMDTSNREKHFPTSLIVECIKHNLKNVDAERVGDRKHVLNSIIGIDLDAEPSEVDDKYDVAYNDAFRAHFATSGTLKTALLLNDGSWQKNAKGLAEGKDENDKV